jgi:histidinol-phosphatase (PHP family)
MAYRELDEYVDIIRNSRSPITVLAGGECEYVKADRAYYREELLGKYGLDYLLGAPHWIPCRGEWIGYSHLESPKDLICFADYCTDLMESGLFLYVAHPDVFMVGYPKWDENALSCAEDIISAALECDIPLEFNANGLRKSAVTSEEEMEHSLYPNLNFWKVAAQRKVKCVIGSDAHSPELLTDSLELCEHMAGSLGLQLVDPLVL